MIDASEDREVLLNRLAEEFAAHQRVGERPSLHEYCKRHPELTEEIRSLFPALVELERVKADAGSELAVATAPTITNLGDFRLLREVGRGGMGVVYEAEQISLGRRVALKLLPATVLSDPNRRLRFEREAKAAAKLHHTNIVPVHGFGEHDGTPYYVMQFIPGLGLDAVIEELRRLPTDGRSGVSHQLLTGQKAAMSVALARSLVGADMDRTAAWNPADDNAHATTACGGTTPDVASLPRLDSVPSVSLSSSAAQLPGQSGSGIGALAKKKFTYWESVAQIGVQVGGALAYAHKQGVLHRDIKPANLLLDLDGIVWVTDFGLAKADDSDNLTQTGDILGTWRYMSPEAFEGKSDVRSDIYSLGLTLYELLALRPAFDDKERKKLIKQVTTGEPTPLDRLRREVPRDLVTIVHKSIAKEPARRYSSAEEMASDLQRFIDDEPILARRQTQLERYVRWARHNPGIAVLGAVLTAVLVLATFASLIVAGHMSNLARNEAQAAEDERIIRRQAVELRKRADTAAQVAQQNLYYAQMHLGQHAWREHRGLPQLHELLTNWLPKQELPDRRGWEWYYLNSLPYQNIRVLAKSDDSGNLPCCIVAWHAASKRLATGTSDGLIRIWDIDREHTTLVLKGPGPAGSTHWEAKWFAWSPDGRKLAAGFRDGTLHLWETGSGREMSIFRGHTSPVMSAAYSSDGLRLAAWGENGAIKIWESDTGQLIADVAHSRAITTGAWSPDDKLLATGHEDGTVTISGTQAGDKIVTLRGHLSQIHALAWRPDGARLASTSFDFTTRIWDVALEKTVVGPLRHSHEITSAAWEPNGKRLATGSIDETVKIWNSTTGHEDLTLRGHVSPVTSLAWIPDGRLASGGHDGSVKIWTSISDQESSVLPGHDVRATSVSWSPNGKLLASGGDDGKVRIWDAATHEEIRAIKAHDESRISQQFGLILSLSWSPNGAQLASGSLDGTAKVFEVASGREVIVLPNNRGSVWSVAWSPDGNRLAVGSQDGTIRMIEEINETPKVQVINAHQSRVRGLAWSPQGDRLASAGADKLVKVWDPIRGAELAQMQGHQFAVFRTSWSPDGKRLASCGADFRLVMTWDAQTGQRLTTMRGHNDWAEAVVWSPDGTRLASAGNDNSVRIWDPRSGEETLQLRGTAGFFHDVSWHPDGKKLVAASTDGQIWIWDATPGFEHDRTPRTLLKEENRKSHDKPDPGSAQ